MNVVGRIKQILAEGTILPKVKHYIQVVRTRRNLVGVKNSQQQQIEGHSCRLLYMSAFQVCHNKLKRASSQAVKQQAQWTEFLIRG